MDDLVNTIHETCSYDGITLTGNDYLDFQILATEMITQAGYSIHKPEFLSKEKLIALKGKDSIKAASFMRGVLFNMRDLNFPIEWDNKIKYFDTRNNAALSKVDRSPLPKSSDEY